MEESGFTPKNVIVTSTYLRKEHGFEDGKVYQTVPGSDDNHGYDCLESVSKKDYIREPGYKTIEKKRIVKLYSHEYKTVDHE